MKILNVLGSLLFMGLTVNLICKYGTQWDLSGEYHMPTTLVSPDGKTYLDGTPIDAITKVLVDRGIEQEAWLVIAGVLTVIFTYVALLKGRSKRMHRKAFEDEFRSVHDMPPHDNLTRSPFKNERR